jgi:drug/metabolite transporter (DMT)-like permease
MSYLVYTGAGRIPSAELAFMRAAFSFLALSPYVTPHVRKAFARGSGTLWLRSAAGAISMQCYFWNLQSSNVGTANTFANLAPVFVALLAWIFLREAINKPEAVGIALAVAGAISINAPWANPPRALVTVVGVMGSLSASVSYLALREAVLEFSSPLVVWCLSVVTMAACPFAPGAAWILPQGGSWLLIAGVGAAGLMGQVLMTRSFVYVRPQVASVLALTSLAWGLVLQIAFEGKVPRAGEWLAYALVLLGVALLQLTAPSRSVAEAAGE